MKLVGCRGRCFAPRPLTSKFHSCTTGRYERLHEALIDSPFGFLYSSLWAFIITANNFKKKRSRSLVSLQSVRKEIICSGVLPFLFLCTERRYVYNMYNQSSLFFEKKKCRNSQERNKGETQEISFKRYYFHTRYFKNFFWKFCPHKEVLESCFTRNKYYIYNA